MQTHLSILRAIRARYDEDGPRRSFDPDLDEEAGMDGTYRRLLQAARDLDDEEAEELWAAQQDREAAEAGPDHY